MFAPSWSQSSLRKHQYSITGNSFIDLTIGQVKLSFVPEKFVGLFFLFSLSSSLKLKISYIVLSNCLSVIFV